LRAARHLANYAAQGRVMVEASAASYLAGGAEEVEQMSVFDPAFTSLAVLPPPVPPPTGDATELAASVIPERFRDLRASLPLYLADLPTTPGAVVPGLVLDIVASLGKLLTCGTVDAGAAEITALNAVLPGGPANRQRTADILSTLVQALRSDDASSSVPKETEEAARKLFGQLAVRWDDDALTDQYLRHREVLMHLSASISEDAAVALAVTGSFPDAPGGWWHPFLSDIDVMPLRLQEPAPAEVEYLQRLYDSTPRPPWVYLNYGACAGVAGLVHDPRTRLFVAEHLPSFTAEERRLLGVLLGPSRFLAGRRTIYDAFRAAFAALPAPTLSRRQQ
ncbi:hypothetical protein ACFQ07_23555, partial [Actinomadura adrarensis]